jgi:hypothetical protein
MFEVLNPIVQAHSLEIVGFVARSCDYIRKIKIKLMWARQWKNISCTFVVGELSLVIGYL